MSRPIADDGARRNHRARAPNDPSRPTRAAAEPPRPGAQPAPRPKVSFHLLKKHGLSGDKGWVAVLNEYEVDSLRA